MKRIIYLVCILSFWTIPICANIQFQFVEGIGQFGSSRGCFNSPSGITGDSQYLFICDSGNNRIVKLDPVLKTTDQFDALPDALYGLDHPQEIVLYQGNRILISDTQNNRIVQYNYQGNYVKSFGILGISNGEFDTPKGISETPNGNLIVVDSGNNRIQIFNPSIISQKSQSDVQFALTLVFGSDYLDHPYNCIVTRTGNFLVTSTFNNKVMLFDNNGNFIKSIWKSDSFLRTPTGLAQDETGNFYVVDTGNKRILYFDINGTILGTIDTHLVIPMDIWIMQDKLYVTDRGINQILVFQKMP